MFLEEPGIYYEVHGQGPPVVLLNGIMMNCLSWVDHIADLKSRYRLIAWDMRDQGQSRRLEPGYSVDLHVEDLKRLLLHLEIDRGDLLSVSFGAQVALLFALKYPAMVNRLVLANATDHVDGYLLALGRMWKAAARLNDGEAFFDLALPPVYSRTFYNDHSPWLENRRALFKKLLTREWFEGLIRLASSNENFDLRDRIAGIESPTLLISGAEDTITPHAHMLAMHRKMPNSRIVSIPDTGHAAFLEKRDTFCTLVKGFL